jgi:hypothetical protein
MRLFTCPHKYHEFIREVENKGIIPAGVAGPFMQNYSIALFTGLHFKPPKQKHFDTSFTRACVVIGIDLEAHKDKNSMLSSLVHEAYHAAMWYFRGLGDDKPSEECVAVLIEQIVEALAPELDKQISEHSKSKPKESKPNVRSR